MQIFYLFIDAASGVTTTGSQTKGLTTRVSRGKVDDNRLTTTGSRSNVLDKI